MLCAANAMEIAAVPLAGAIRWSGEQATTALRPLRERIMAAAFVPYPWRPSREGRHCYTGRGSGLYNTRDLPCFLSPCSLGSRQATSPPALPWQARLLLTTGAGRRPQLVNGSMVAHPFPCWRQESRLLRVIGSDPCFGYLLREMTPPKGL